MLRVTNIQVYPIREPTGNLIAYVRVLLEDALQVTGIRLLQNPDGSQALDFPKGEGGYRLFELDEGTQKAILDAVVGEYKEATS